MTPALKRDLTEPYTLKRSWRYGVGNLQRQGEFYKLVKVIAQKPKGAKLHGDSLPQKSSETQNFKRLCKYYVGFRCFFTIWFGVAWTQ